MNSQLNVCLDITQIKQKLGTQALHIKKLNIINCANILNTLVKAYSNF